MKYGLRHAFWEALAGPASWLWVRWENRVTTWFYVLTVGNAWYYEERANWRKCDKEAAEQEATR